ncbi:14450_t:CDS:1, partial [Cetraspora pellucida]
MGVNANLYPSFEYYPIPPLFDDLSLEAQQYGSEPSIVTDMYNYENVIDNVINTHNEEKSDDDIEYESTELDVLKLTTGMEFDTWEIAESYLEDCAKQEGFCFRKRRCYTDPTDNTITRHRTYECSQACIHQAEKVVLMENRRERDSGM